MNLFKRLFFTPVVVTWETTNLNYTPSGPRRTGEFTAKTLFGAWLWGQCFTFFNQRGGVYIDPASAPAAQINLEKTMEHQTSTKSGISHDATNGAAALAGTNERVDDVVNDVLQRGAEYDFSQDEDSVREAVEESANLLRIELSDDDIAVACQRILGRD
jgi:hypothetical protein